MQGTQKTAPGALCAQGLANIGRLDSAALHDCTPDAAASALQIGMEAATSSALHLLGGDPHASLIAAYAAIKALGAAADSLLAIVGRG